MIYRQRCAGRGEETSQRGGRLRHGLSSGLIYSYWDRVIHSPEHIFDNKLGIQKLPFSSAAGSQRIPEL